MALHEKICFLRTKVLGLSCEKFARKLDVDRRSVYAWENNEAKPSFQNIIKLAIACHVTIDCLLIDKDPLVFTFENTDDENFAFLCQFVELCRKKNHPSS